MRFKSFLIVAIFSTITFSSIAQDTTKQQNAAGKPDTTKKELVISLKNIEQVEKLLEKKDPDWFTRYGAVLVAIVALLGTVLTNAMTNRRSWLNTQAQLTANSTNLTEQLKAAEKNILTQIVAAKNQEIETRAAELQLKQKNELKETVAKFINSATKLNSQLNYIIYSELENGRRNEAIEAYDNTSILRTELADTFYSIKVTLDASQKQVELERLLNSYMDATCFNFNIDTITSENYQPPIAKLYHKIKSIVHDNYVEPV